MDRKTALFTLPLLLTAPGYAQEKLDIVPDNVKFFREIFTRKNSYVKGEFESTEDFKQRRPRWDSAKTFYIALPVDNIAEKSYFYDADKELISVFGGPGAERTASSKWDSIEVGIEFGPERYEERIGSNGRESVEVVDIYTFLILPENRPGLQASKVWSQLIPDDDRFVYNDEKAGLNSIVAQFNLKRADAKQIAANLRIVLAVRFADWDSFFKDGLKVSRLKVLGPTEHRTYAAVAKAKILKVLVVDSTTGNVWKTIPISDAVAAAPGAKQRTLPPPPPEPKRDASTKIGELEPQLSEGLARSVRRIRREEGGVVDSGSLSPTQQRERGSTELARARVSVESSVPGGATAILDFSDWLDAFTSRPMPAPRGEFETTEEYNRRTSDYMDASRIFTVLYAANVLPEKGFDYEADTAKLTLKGSKLTASGFLVIQQRAGALDGALEALKVPEQTYWTIGDWELGGSISLSRFDGLIVTLKFPRDKAREMAKNLRLRLGFQVPDPRAPVKESKELVRTSGELRPTITQVRSVEADLRFVEVFDSMTGEVVARIAASVSSTASATDLLARGNAQRSGRGGDGLRDSTVNARGGSGKGVKGGEAGAGDGGEPGVRGNGNLSDGGKRGGSGRDGDDIGTAARGNAGRTPRTNRDASPTSKPFPKLTDEMKQRKLNAKIVISVEVDVDGSHTETILTGSGDEEVDALILKTLKRWKWSPAIFDSSPTKQKIRYRFTISVK